MASANCDPTPTLEHMTVVEAQSPTNWWTQELDNFQAIMMPKWLWSIMQLALTALTLMSR
ncbi:hypothetical protein AYX15_06603 [Cryptococcus neoformans]|nr:hypothetical protein AYX15_06603 [Cryptococcus neoformans var. grubii]